MSIENKPNLVRQIAIVTGGSRGLGRSTVLSLARRGIDSIFTYNSNRAEAEKVTALVASTECKAIALQLDTGNVRTFDVFTKNVRQALTGLKAERFDFLVNNAGTSFHKAFEINRRVADMTALGRVGQPDDIGPMIASLFSEDNRWVNGQRI